jgi:hypothetical protein
VSAIAWLAGGIGLAGLVAIALYYIRRALSNSVALDERDAALRVEAQRIAKEESAAAQARSDRAKELDAKVDSVCTVDDAVAVLRGELSRAVGTPASDVVSGSGNAASPAPVVAPKP